MTTVARDLRPRAKPLAVEMCEATRRAHYNNDTPHTDRMCKNRARYDINGKKLCKQHAGPAALDLLLTMRRGKK